MDKYTFAGQPALRLLGDGQIETIHEQALHVLEATGVMFESEEALKILADHGANVDFGRKTAKMGPQMVDDALRKVPSTLVLYDRDGEPAAELGGSAVHFDPGSSLIKFLEADGKTVRRSESGDLVRISRVNDALDHVRLQSTAVVCYDVPKPIGDSYRLYLCLKNSPKAVITGAFSVAGVAHMRRLLAAVAGGEDELREKPRAVFDICPSPPLKWTHISAQNIIDCARFGLPLETVSMPMPGAATPVTLAGSIVIHTAETLSGIVLAQCVNPGAPVVYGGAPVHFDMRFGTTPLSAVEATMIAAAYSQMGKYFGLPTHTYAALSDAKIVDAQAGFETGVSGIIAQLAGINMISGVGSLDFVSTFSIEKLVIDNEICGMALRLQRGIDCSPEALAVELIDSLGPGGVYLESEHTFTHFRTEPFIPSPVVDRRDRSSWAEAGSKSVFERARERVLEIENTHLPTPLDGARGEALDRAALAVMDELNVTELPRGPR